MKIAVNSRFLLDNKLEGIGWFTYETFRRITVNHPEHQFIFFFDRPYAKKFIFSSNIEPKIVYPPARHPVLWYWWFEHSIPKILKEYNPELFVSTDGFLSLSTIIKSLVVIHDLNFEHYPENLRWLVKKYLLHYTKKFAHKATRIVTVSNYSKNDIVQTYNISPDNIDVAYNGASNIYRPLNEKEKSEAKNEFARGCEYFVYIGAMLPRKNIARLLKAFDDFKITTGSNTKLVIVGEKMFNTSDIKLTHEKMRYRNEVIFTGRLEQGKIEKALGGALSLIYVSYFEGFGIPIVEAMNADVPVVTSNITSMPEIAGDAAIQVDPFSVESIKNGLIQIYKDEKLRASLIEKGEIRKQAFNWDNTAEQLWKSIEKCLIQ
jgi:glycosyltransferase involved in cell wall biosynthesis